MATPFVLCSSPTDWKVVRTGDALVRYNIIKDSILKNTDLSGPDIDALYSQSMSWVCAMEYENGCPPAIN